MMPRLRRGNLATCDWGLATCIPAKAGSPLSYDLHLVSFSLPLAPCDLPSRHGGISATLRLATCDLPLAP